MMGCVTTPSFFVLINGKPYGNIKSSRGIHRGNPLSPYLFFLCAKGFNSLLSRAEIEGRIKCVSICRRAPSITNLMFADDSILFCRATFGEDEVINEALKTYVDASKQCINMEKSLVYFSSNTQAN